MVVEQELLHQKHRKQLSSQAPQGNVPYVREMVGWETQEKFHTSIAAAVHNPIQFTQPATLAQPHLLPHNAA